MPFMHDVDPGRGLAQARFRGVVTEDEVRCCLSRVWSDSAWSPDLSVLLDLFAATEVRLSCEFLRHFSSIMATAQDQPSKPRTAVIVSPRLLSSEDWKDQDRSRSDSDHFRVFPRRGPALEWVSGGRGAGAEREAPDPPWACRVRFHPSEPLLHVRFDGVLRGSELRGLREEVVSDSRWSNRRHILVDLARVTSTDLHATDLINVIMEAERGGRPSDRGRLACLAPHRGSIEILQRYRALLLAFPREVNVLRGIDETLDWLGMPPEVKAWLADEKTTE
jgi:hypothetical protein